MQSFTTRWPVRFADVDAAGIVYYPRFFDYYHCAFEDLFAATHGLPYPRWISERRVGFPTVHVEADFRAPLRYGEDVITTVTIARLGARSVAFAFALRCTTAEADAGCAPRATAVVTKACVDLDGLVARALPEDLRAAWASLVTAPAAPGPGHAGPAAPIFRGPSHPGPSHPEPAERRPS